MVQSSGIKHEDNNKAVSLKNVHIDPISVNHPKILDLLVQRADEKELTQIFNKVMREPFRLANNNNSCEA
jgi:hypothetical protein